MNEMNEMTTVVLPSLENAEAKEIAEAIAEVLDAKKGFDVEVLYVADKTVVAEYFVVCSGNTSTHIKALVGETEFKIGERVL